MQSKYYTTIFRTLPSILVALVLVFVTGCAQLLKKDASNSEPLASGNSSENAVATGDSDKQAPDSFADFNLEDDTLYDLLVAEIAAQRNQFNVTLLNYIQQARHTRDPGVIRRAINAAQFAKDGLAIKELALLWEEVEPDNPSVHQLLAYQFSLEKQYSDAIRHIDKAIQLGGRISIESLAIGSQSLPDAEKLVLLELYQKLLTSHPDNRAVSYSIAIIQSNLKQFDEALVRLNTIIEEDEDFQPAYVLKSNVLFELKRLGETRAFLEDAYDKFPKNHSIARLYASTLIDAKELDEAEDIFGRLREDYPQTTAFKLSHALVKLENNKTDESKTILEELLAANVHVDDANFYLGRIADVGQDPATAVKHYLSIKGGPNQAAARERAIFLLIQDEKYDETRQTLDELRQNSDSQQQKDSLWALEFRLFNSFELEELAMNTLSDALEDNPANQDLLYARAMLKERDGNLEAMEADLRTIMDLDPGNAIAMNALGYTLADKTDRIAEAKELIARALEILPDNPAILDSMGWVLFKDNRPEEALIYLLRAFQAMPDGEIGAHLGEVLLALGQKTEAYEIWTKSLELAPDHAVLRQTVERLAPELLPETNSETSAEATEQQNTDESNADAAPPAQAAPDA